MDRKEYKLVCVICLHIAAKTSGLYNLYTNDGLEQEQNQKLSRSMSALHQEEADTKDEPLPLSCSYGLIKQDSLFSSSSPASMVTNDDGETIISTPDTTSYSLAAATPAKHYVRRRPQLDILSLSGLSALSSKEYTISQLASAELYVLQKLQWKGVVSSNGIVDWCLILLDMRGDDCQRSAIRECALINSEYAIENMYQFGTTGALKTDSTENYGCCNNMSNSLLALAAIVHALDTTRCDECMASRLLGVSPFQEDEIYQAIHLYFPKVEVGARFV